MLAWILSLFRPSAPPRRAAVPHKLPREAAPATPKDAAPRAPLPARVPGLALDHARAHTTQLAAREQGLLARIGARIAQGQLELPQLPATSLAAIDMCARPHAEIRDIVQLVQRDPVLSSELLRTANSVVYAGAEPARTIDEAVLRVGLRTLRSMLYAISVRGQILNEKSLATYAQEVWRQSSSMAVIARALAQPLKMDPERAYLIGLLHDVGKLPLLAMLGKAVGKESEVTPPLIGRLFREHHEAAGAALARAWKLPDELADVAANHHRFETNATQAKSAALASLAHKLDLFLSMDSEEEFRALTTASELDFLEASDETRHDLLARAKSAFESQLAEAAAR